MHYNWQCSKICLHKIPTYLGVASIFPNHKCAQRPACCSSEELSEFICAAELVQRSRELRRFLSQSTCRVLLHRWILAEWYSFRNRSGIRPSQQWFRTSGLQRVAGGGSKLTEPKSALHRHRKRTHTSYDAIGRGGNNHLRSQHEREIWPLSHSEVPRAILVP